MVRRNAKRRSGRRLRGALPVSMRGIGPRRRGGVRKKSRLVRHTKRRMGPAGRVGVKRRRVDNVSGSYQFTRAKRTTGRFKSVSMLNRTLMAAGKEHVMYGWRAMKIFDNNGSLHLERNLVTLLPVSRNAAQMPVYVMSLNGVNRTTETHWPMYRLHAWAEGPDDGKLFFNSVAGDSPNGATADPALTYMFDGTSASSNRFDGQRAVLRYIDLQMNLWGATAKSTRFTIQVIKVHDEECDPWKLKTTFNAGVTSRYTDVLSPVGQQAWQELVKQYTFNPLAKIDYLQSKKIRVLKTYDVVVQPNSSTDGDADPSCRTLKWFMKWDRLVRFDEHVSTLNPIVDDLTYLNNDMRMELGTVPTGITPPTKGHLMLLIRATNYKSAYGSFSNGNDGSFDIDYKAKWTHLD